MLQNTTHGHKAQANPTYDPGTKYNSTNYKSTTSYDQNTKSGLQPLPTLVNTPHPAYHRHSPCPLINSLPHSTSYAISHHPSDYRSSVPYSPTTPFYPLYNQLILNPFIILKHLHSHHKHIIIHCPASSSHLNPTPPHLNTQDGVRVRYVL